VANVAGSDAGIPTNVQSLQQYSHPPIRFKPNAGALIPGSRRSPHYNPQVMVFEDTATKGSRRCPRIQVLTKRLVAVAESRTIKVKLFSQTQVRRVFLGDDRGTKHALAKIIVQRFPEELGFRLPPKRRAWMSEDSRMDIFDAVALALAYFYLYRAQVKTRD
jgi:hypothetical protein